MVIDNAASRLVSILKEADLINGNDPCREAWERILSCKQGDNSELFVLLGNAMRLPAEVASLVILHFPHQADTIALWKNPIEAAFLHQNLQSNWHSFLHHLNPYCIPQLSLVADLLHTKIGATVLPVEQLEELRVQFTNLLEDIAKTDLPNALKIYLSREITQLLQLLREYGICGAEPILHQADAMYCSQQGISELSQG
jgi:hypothetical protein